MQLPDYDRAQAMALLKEKPGAPLSAFDIASRAHRRWDLKQPADAALLFCLACERAQQEAATPNQAPNYFVRAAITFNQAGDRTTAEPMLREATQLNWQALGLGQDSHMCEWAFTQLLLNLQHGPAPAFSDLFTQAVTDCSAQGRNFPSIHPQQDELLPIAIELQLPHIVKQLADRMAARRPLSRPVKAQLQQARQWLEQQPA